MRVDNEKKKPAENIILMVDDDVATRQTIRKILTGNSSRLIDSIDPATLLNTYQQYLPSLVLIDAQVSLENGYDRVKEILAYDPQAFIVMLSEDRTEHSIVECKERGAKGFIAKPFNRDILLKYVALASAHKARQPAHPGLQGFRAKA